MFRSLALLHPGNPWRRKPRLPLARRPAQQPRWPLQDQQTRGRLAQERRQCFARGRGPTKQMDHDESFPNIGRKKDFMHRITQHTGKMIHVLEDCNSTNNFRTTGSTSQILHDLAPKRQGPTGVQHGLPRYGPMVQDSTKFMLLQPRCSSQDANGSGAGHFLRGWGLHG